MKILINSLVRFFFYAALLLLGAGAIAGMFLVFHVAKDLPKLPEDLNQMISTPQTVIYSASGQVLMGLGEQKSIPLSLVSRDFINAILATEDHRFFSHHGINKLRMIKGLYVTLFKPGRVEGASTITQQLAKNMFFSFKQSFKRKFQEMLVAFQIEAANSKADILEAYVNQIHFGAGAQGIEKAAQTFFGKPALALNLSEAALLAGLPKSPTAYNPFHHLERAVKRRNIVLNRMAALGVITGKAARQAAKAPVTLSHDKKDSRSGSYFIDALIRRLIQSYGETVVFHGGLRVYSTLDQRLQAFARQSLKQGLENMDTLMGKTETDTVRPQGALVALDTRSGAVRAMVGGRDYFTSEFNRAMDSRRQPGSGFKPFVYYTALKTLHLHPGSVMTDQKIMIPVKGALDWEPKNFEKKYQGPMILKQALIRSVNTIAARLVWMTGPEAVVATALSCGIKSPLSPVFSIALGTSRVSPFEMASAYAVFANQGVGHDSFFIRRVEGPLGQVLFEHIVRDKQVLEPALAYQVVDMMKGVIDSGSGRAVRRSGFTRAAAGKTGTTDDYNDAWFTGFTPSLSTSVWIGFDRKKRLRDVKGQGITGGRGAAPVWADFMGKALIGEPERDFPIPDSIRFESVDPVTGCAPDPKNSGESMVVALKPDQKICGGQ